MAETKILLLDIDNTVLPSIEISTSTVEVVLRQLAKDKQVQAATILRAQDNFAEIFKNTPDYAERYAFDPSTVNADAEDAETICYHGSLLPDMENGFRRSRADPLDLANVIANTDFATEVWGSVDAAYQAVKPLVKKAYEDIGFDPYEGVDELIAGAREDGVLVCVLTDANADFGAARMEACGVIHGEVDLVISRSDKDYPHNENDDVAIVASPRRYLQHTPHLVVANMNVAPKHTTEIYSILADYFTEHTGQDIGTENIAILDDNLDICIKAASQGVNVFNAAYGTPKGEDFTRLRRISPGNGYIKGLVEKALQTSSDGFPDNITPVYNPAHVLDHITPPSAPTVLTDVVAESAAIMDFHPLPQH